MTHRPAFNDLLGAAWTRTDAFLCVGLDPLLDRLPTHLQTRSKFDAIDAFCRAIVDATAAYASAFKPQIAHFASLGLEELLVDLIAYIHERHPQVPVLLDAKRGDIGSTAERYAVEAFERYRADAVTVNPFLGPESVAPFLAYRDRGTVLLCRTSNADSAWLQDVMTSDGEPIYLRIARQAAEWNVAGNLMLVAGATYPEELGEIRAAAGDTALLVPGVGEQGGDLAAVFRHGATADGFGLLVNSARGILYAGGGEDYAAAAAAVAAQLVGDMRALRAGHNSG
ncbi:MAG: orotidine-5'-phosphate decarboxylase [Pseudomonadota bacterium]